MKTIAFTTAFGATHSVALAGQFLALSLFRLKDHIDLYRLEGCHPWPRILHGLHNNDAIYLESIPNANPDFRYDVRINYGCAPEASIESSLILNYFVSEYGNGINLVHFNNLIREGENFIVPSEWVKRLLISQGTLESGVKIVNCGVNPAYFFPLSREVNENARHALGLKSDQFIFLNVGALTRNKGFAYLIKAFNVVASENTNALLFIKDSRDLYGISADSLISEFIDQGLLHFDRLSQIRTISGNLSLQQLLALYNIADCYVSPYIAEGFNAPVLESIACGTPVIVTSGGPTDEFVFKGAGKKIDSRPVDSYQGVAGSFLIPSVEHLISLMSEEIASPRKFTNNFQNASQQVVEVFSYDSIARRFINEVLI